MRFRKFQSGGRVGRESDTFIYCQVAQAGGGDKSYKEMC